MASSGTVPITMAIRPAVEQLALEQQRRLGIFHDYHLYWQLAHKLATPRLLPAGTALLFTGYFDNSVNNPRNPDATAELTWGEQSGKPAFFAREKRCPYRAGPSMSSLIRPRSGSRPSPLR